MARLTVSAAGTAPADRVWELMAHPATWPAWGPHLWHVVAADGSVPAPIEKGQRLRALAVTDGIGLPVEITEVRPGRAWSMRAEVPLLGPVWSHHAIGADGSRTEVVVEIEAPGLRGPLGNVALRAYWPLASLAVRRLLAIGEAEARGAEVARHRMCGAAPRRPTAS